MTSFDLYSFNALHIQDDLYYHLVHFFRTHLFAQISQNLWMTKIRGDQGGNKLRIMKIGVFTCRSSATEMIPVPSLSKTLKASQIESSANPAPFCLNRESQCNKRPLKHLSFDKIHLVINSKKAGRLKEPSPLAST